MAGKPGAPDRLEVSHDAGVVSLRLNRPEARNAIDDALQAAIVEEFERIASAADVRVVVLTGAGTAFCAGGDVKAMNARLEAPEGAAVAGWRRLRGTRRMITSLQDLPVVTIAAVNGPAVGVGFDLALACDFVLVSESAFFSAAFIQRGLVPDGGGLYTLPRRVGLARAKDLVFSGRRVGAEEALRLGIADRIVAPDELAGVASRLAGEYARGSPTAIALAKSILNRTFESTREQVLEQSAAAQAMCYTTDEHRAGVHTFLGTTRERS